MSKAGVSSKRASRAARPPEAAPGTDPEVLDRLRDYVRVQVRTGVHDAPSLRRLALEASSAEFSDPGAAAGMADRLLHEELQDWHRDAAGWIGRTDPERLDASLARLTADGVATLAGLLDQDALEQRLQRPMLEVAELDVTGISAARPVVDGVLAYLVPDIWVALDTNRLRLTVLDRSGAHATRRSPLVTQIIDALADEGLLASSNATEDGGVLVTMHWRRRPRGDADGPTR